MFLKRRALSVLAILTAAVSARGAVVFTENFEGGLGAWTTNFGTPVANAAPTAPPEDPSSTLSYQDTGTGSRIGRGFTAASGVTSFKLTAEFYTNSTSTSQRYYAGLVAGTAAAPSTSTGGFSRIGTNNVANFVYFYSNPPTTTINAAALAIGWHKSQITVTPGVSGVGQITFQLDSAAPVTLTNLPSTLLTPTNVQLGQNVSTGNPAWFDSIMVEQFAPAASKATVPSPVNGDTGDNPNTTTLGWTPGASNLSTQDLLFGTDPTLTAGGDQVLTGQTAATNSYNPGTLVAGTTYFWEVVSRNSLGDATAGDVWSFTTAAAPEPASLSLVGVLAGGLLSRRRRSVKA